MLQINRNGLLYKIAYNHAIGEAIDWPDCANNPCQFVRHILLGLIVWTFQFPVSWVARLIGWFLCFLVGVWPKSKETPSSEESFYLAPIEWIPKIRGRRIWPIAWIALPPVLWFVGQRLLTVTWPEDTFGEIGRAAYSSLVLVTKLLVTLVLSVVLIILLFWIKKQLGELWAVVWGAIKAAKQRVCPFIEYVESSK